LNCVNCGGKPYAEDAIGLPYCKNCVADHDSFARRTLVGGYDPQSRERVAWASNPNTAPQGRVRGSNRVEYINKNRTGEKVSELRKKFERAEGKKKKAETLKWHEEHPETQEDEMERWIKNKKDWADAEDDIFN